MLSFSGNEPSRGCTKLQLSKNFCFGEEGGWKEMGGGGGAHSIILWLSRGMTGQEGWRSTEFLQYWTIIIIILFICTLCWNWKWICSVSEDQPCLLVSLQCGNSQQNFQWISNLQTELSGLHEVSFDSHQGQLCCCVPGSQWHILHMSFSLSWQSHWAAGRHPLPLPQCCTAPIWKSVQHLPNVEHTRNSVKSLGPHVHNLGKIL